MKYNPPYGSSDPDEAYVDRSTPNAQSGSKVPRQAVEHPQREIVKVITEAGLTPSESDLTQLWQAIGIMIERVRVNLPIYPVIKTASGKLTVTPISPGLIRIPAGQQFTMRGGPLVTTAETDLATVASRTYHLRWTEASGFVLKSLADTSYNASGLAADEILPAFDSGYDDMLVAKVVTNGSNVATITTLVNKAYLEEQVRMEKGLGSQLNWVTLTDSAVGLDWARTPDWAEPMWQGFRSFLEGPTGVAHGLSAGIIRAVEIRKTTVTRYGVGDLEYWYEDDALNNGFLVFIWSILARG